jgi:hypothetical protein
MCTSLLRRGDQVEVQSLRSQVNFLHSENRKLTMEMAEMEKKLKDLVSEQNLGWIESLMTSANYESRDLKEKLMREMMDKTSLSDNFARAQKDLAHARLDCVKLKILLSRIVDMNEIRINENDFLDVDIDQEVLENLKIDKFEPKSPEAAGEDNASLNESTIILIGGRERLGNFIPPKLSMDDSKENLSPVKPSTPPRPEPLREIQPPQEVLKQQEAKSVTFRSSVEAKVIDVTQEQFEQSNQARKRNPIVVKRITVPSRAAKKAE